tara:strand:- start:9 stop:227 length:219 start_codon:yes stop_codon:yes gene_type:complete
MRVKRKGKKMKYQDSALYAIHQENIKIRDYFQAKLDRNETDEYYTIERIQELIDWYQSSIDYDNEWIKKNIK